MSARSGCSSTEESIGSKRRSISGTTQRASHTGFVPTTAISISFDIERRSPKANGSCRGKLAATSNPRLPAVECKVQGADQHASHGENGCRDVGIYKFVEVVEKKTTLIWFDAGFGFQPVFQNGKRTWPKEEFGEDTPDQGNDVEAAKERARTCHKGTEDHPQNEQRVQCEDANR